jgi:hypothetical protein
VASPPTSLGLKPKHRAPEVIHKEEGAYKNFSLANSKTNRRREIIKIRAEINEIENKNTIQGINETKS